MPPNIQQLYKRAQQESAPRMCALQAYCNARRLAGYQGPLCPHCDQVTFLVDLWSRVFGLDPVYVEAQPEQQQKLIAGFERSGMTRKVCPCGCEFWTRHDFNTCPPCRGLGYR